MRKRLKAGPSLTLLVMLLGTSSLLGVRTLKMNLKELSLRSHQILRGTVLSVQEATVAVGGTELPVVTYQIRVAEGLKGTFSTKDHQEVAEITMLAQEKAVQAGGIRRMSLDLAMPELKVGQEYLLFTSRPSRVGLSSTIGLGQGCFSLEEQDKVLLATNEIGNLGLFDGMGITQSQSLSYQQLAELIREQLR